MHFLHNSVNGGACCGNNIVILPHPKKSGWRDTICGLIKYADVHVF